MKLPAFVTDASVALNVFRLDLESGEFAILVSPAGRPSPSMILSYIGDYVFSDGGAVDLGDDLPVVWGIFDFAGELAPGTSAVMPAL